MTIATTILLALAQASAPGQPPGAPGFERAIEGVRPGRVAVRLDRDVYESARADLSDLRVIADDGSLVPFLVDRGERAASPADVTASVRNRGWHADGAATAVLDFRERVPKTRLRLALSGDNFRRRVAVEGSDDGEQWTTLVDEAWVFAVPGQEPNRYETVPLPENDFPLLRIAVHPGEGERNRVQVLGATIPARADSPRHEEVLHPKWTRSEDTKAHESWLTVDLGARRQPFNAVGLEVADERFFREVRLEARRDGRAGAARVSWLELGRGAVYRLEHGGRRRECLQIDVSGRERVVRLTVSNGDDRPLAVRGIAFRVPVERVVFEAAAGRAYRLAYGSPTASAPAFDLARTVGDAGSWATAAAEAVLGPARRRVGAPSPLPWTERRPALLWGGLLGVVAVLGLLTWRALRQMGQ